VKTVPAAARDLCGSGSARTVDDAGTGFARSIHGSIAGRSSADRNRTSSRNVNNGERYRSQPIGESIPLDQRYSTGSNSNPICGLLDSH
jgi:hypothetical protein